MHIEGRLVLAFATFHHGLEPHYQPGFLEHDLDPLYLAWACGEQDAQDPTPARLLDAFLDPRERPKGC